MARRRSLPVLADEAIRLVPLGGAYEAQVSLLAEDDAVRRHTRVPTHPTAGFAREWIRTYEKGWRGRTRAGFAIESHQGEFLGLGLFVKIEEEARQGEVGYIVSQAARGRGVATRTLKLLTDWGFSELGLVRIELWIDTTNPGSERVAERAGYTREGVLRSYFLKEDLRRDFAIWSRILGEREGSGTRAGAAPSGANR
jgi:ribosomal-protein-alanine N-acetyltransferase